MLHPSISPLEIVIRVVVLYLALVLLVRLAGKREVGQLSPLDLLAMLILSETVSPALTVQDSSLPGSLLASATLLALTGLMGRLSYRSRRLERWIEGSPTVLVEDGELDREAARRERITQQELDGALRRHGVDSLREVKRAMVEPNGEITVVCKR
jgi:uncharacterized membrane protein YcaP (DUF421 family)